MVRVRRMPAVHRVGPGHMARNAIISMRLGLPVTTNTFRLVINKRLGRLLMRIVARRAPKFSPRSYRTSRNRQLLGMRHHLDSIRRRRNRLHINRKHFFQRLPRTEVAELLPGVGHPRRTRKMALLANTIPRRPLQPFRVHDVRSRWLRHMAAPVAMASPTTDPRLRNRLRRVPVHRPRDRRRRPRMAP